MKKNTRIPLAGQHATPHQRRYALVTDEFRPPRKGEWYASGAIVEAYQAPNDLSTSYWICTRPIPRTSLPDQRTLDLAMKIGDLSPPTPK